MLLPRICVFHFVTLVLKAMFASNKMTIYITSREFMFNLISCIQLTMKSTCITNNVRVWHCLHIINNPYTISMSYFISATIVFFFSSMTILCIVSRLGLSRALKPCFYPRIPLPFSWENWQDALILKASP